MLIISFPLKADNIFVEAESFDCRGGWVLDNQSMGQMGSPYLLAHGLGVPVENASTVIRVENGGKYRVWVRTRDWVKQWDQTASPGRFAEWKSVGGDVWHGESGMALAGWWNDLFENW